MSQAPTLSYAASTKVIRRPRLLIAAIALLLCYLSLLLNRYFGRNIGGPHRPPSDLWTIAVEVVWPVATRLLPAIGITFLAGIFINTSPKTRRLRNLLWLSASLLVMESVIRITLALTARNREYHPIIWTTLSCLYYAVHILIALTILFWLKHAARITSTTWVERFATCTMGLSIVVSLLGIISNIEYALNPPPDFTGTGGAFGMLSQYAAYTPPLLRQILAAISSFTTPIHLLLQIALWFTLALWPGRAKSI